MSNTVSWLGHEFTVLEYSANWNDVAGIYIFAGQNPRGEWYPLYIGQTYSFASRIPSHPEWSAAKRLGATRVHAWVEEEEVNRGALEEELIRQFQPRLNVQLR